MSLRDEMMKKTSSLRTESETAASEEKPSTRPKTAPGMLASLTAAQIRIQELESRGSGAEIPLEDITPNPKQPRKYFDQAAIEVMAKSIESSKLLQPILVRHHPTNEGKYQLVAGERRWRAHQFLKRETIKAIVSDVTDEDLAKLALIENLHRENLTDFEISLALKDAAAEFPYKSSIAEVMGWSRSTLYRYLAFEKLPEFMMADLMTRPGLISGKCAYALNGVISQHGDKAIAVIQGLWPELVAGKIEYPDFPSKVEASLNKRVTSATAPLRDSRKLYNGQTQIGSISKDLKTYVVKIKSSALSNEQEEKLTTFVCELVKGSVEK